MRRHYDSFTMSRDGLIANFLENLLTREFWKSVNIWRRCGQKFVSCILFWLTVQIPRVRCLSSPPQTIHFIIIIIIISISIIITIGACVRACMPVNHRDVTGFSASLASALVTRCQQQQQQSAVTHSARVCVHGSSCIHANCGRITSCAFIRPHRWSALGHLSPQVSHSQ